MAQIKIVGNNGQISLGKEFAGQNVLVESLEYGVWIVKIGQFVPNNETWIYEAENSKKLQKAIDWADSNIPNETNLNELEQKFNSQK